MSIAFKDIKKLYSIKKAPPKQEKKQQKKENKIFYIDDSKSVKLSQQSFAEDIQQFRVQNELKNVFYIPQAISQELEKKFLDFVYSGYDSQEWNSVKSGRRIKCYGGIVTPQGLKQKKPLPQLFQLFTQNLYDQKIFPKKPNHILLNEYYSGEGIMPHTDGPAYFPYVCILSLQSPLILSFWDRDIEIYKIAKLAYYLKSDLSQYLMNKLTHQKCTEFFNTNMTIFLRRKQATFIYQINKGRNWRRLKEHKGSRQLLELFYEKISKNVHVI